MGELKLRVSPEDAGLSVRRLALQRLCMSYTQFKRAKFEGEILLDDQPVHADHYASVGQLLVIRAPEDHGGAMEPCDLPLSVPYEDEDVLVIDKPAPLPSVRSPRKDGRTLENAVYAYMGCPQGYVYRPVNRLDKGTSGLMVVAKHAHAQQWLQARLHGDEFEREYLAVVDGCPPEDEGVIDLPIGKAEGATLRRVIREDGRACRTWYRVVRRGVERTLVRLRLETGRTHQIRVHMQALGCPVTGDFLYGEECIALPGRFALHSCHLAMRVPSGAQITLESPLPPELEALL